MPLSPNWAPFFHLLAKLSNLLPLAKLGTFFGHYVSKHVSHHVNLLIGYHAHLHDGRHVSHHVGHRNVVSTLCDVSETHPDRMEIRKCYGRRTCVPG